MGSRACILTFGWETKERDHLEELDEDARIISNPAFKKYDGSV
jgi:hypothetical protein